jgi:hypothetical protein
MSVGYLSKSVSEGSGSGAWETRARWGGVLCVLLACALLPPRLHAVDDLEELIDTIVRESAIPVAKVQSYEYRLHATFRTGSGMRSEVEGVVVGQGDLRRVEFERVQYSAHGPDYRMSMKAVLNERYFAFLGDAPQIAKYPHESIDRMSGDAKTLSKSMLTDIMRYHHQVTLGRPQFSVWVENLRVESQHWQHWRLEDGRWRIAMNLTGSIRYEVIVSPMREHLPELLHQYVQTPSGWARTLEIEWEWMHVAAAETVVPAYVRHASFDLDGSLQEEIVLHLADPILNRPYPNEVFALELLDDGLVSILSVNADGRITARSALVAGREVEENYHQAALDTGFSPPAVKKNR